MSKTPVREVGIQPSGLVGSKRNYTPLHTLFLGSALNTGALVVKVQYFKLVLTSIIRDIPIFQGFIIQESLFIFLILLLLMMCFPEFQLKAACQHY